MNENTNQKTSKKISAKKRDGPESNLLLEAIKSCEERYQHWQNLYEEGGSDPSYADGVSLSLVRNHIIWRKKQIETACQALGCGLPDIHSRELPPEVAPGYMAKAEEIRENAKAALAVFEKDKEYRALLKEGKGLSEKQKEQVNYSAVIGYVSKLKTELDAEDGIMVYEVEFTYKNTEYEYDINAKSGAIEKNKKETDDDWQENQNSGGSSSSQSSQGASGYIGLAKAKEIALKHAGISGNVTILKETLDGDDYPPVYEIEFYKDGTEYEYEIHAQTGAVLKSDREREQVSSSASSSRIFIFFRSSEAISTSWGRTTIRSQTFCSSLTFPGQLYCKRYSFACCVNTGTETSYLTANRFMKWSARRRISPCLSLRDGTDICSRLIL